MAFLRRTWILLPIALLTLPVFPGPSTETLRAAGECRYVLRLRVSSVPIRWQEYRATVVEALKGDAPRGAPVSIAVCDDLDWAVGEEILVLSDRFSRLRLCGQDGGWPYVRRVTAGSMPWDDWDSPRVPLWLFRLFVPTGVQAVRREAARLE
jgi:hypothetical protein